MPHLLDRTVDWPFWALPLSVVLVIFVIVIHYRMIGRRGRRVAYCLAALRLAILAMLGFMLGGYVLRQDTTELPDLVIVVDDSASMRVVDVYRDAAIDRAVTKLLRSASLPEATRLNIAKAILAEERSPLMERLAKNYSIRLYFVARSALLQEGDTGQLIQQLHAVDGSSLAGEEISAIHNPSAPESEQNASRLGDALRVILQSQRGHSTAAIVVLSDGITTEGSTLDGAAAEALVQGIPLFFVGTGVDSPPLDVELSAVRVEESAFLGDIVRFDCQLTAHGFPGQTAIIQLTNLNDPSEVLAETTLLLAEDGIQQDVVLRYQPVQRGMFEYQVEVIALPGEVSLENNDRTGTINVTDEQINVLLVQDEPTYEFRYLKSLLRPPSQARATATGGIIRLQSVLQQADLSYVETDETARSLFPLEKEELFSFDVVIFGDVNPSLLGHDALNNLHDFVSERGGGLILVAGPRYTPRAFRGTPIEPLFPFDIDEVIVPDTTTVVDTPIYARPTPFGMTTAPLQWEEKSDDNRQRWKNAAPIYWMMQIPRLKAGARILLENPHQFSMDGRPLPIMTSQYIGAGEVIFHATDESWRWRWRGGESYYSHYWRQQIRRLCHVGKVDPQHVVQLSTDRHVYQRGETAILRARFFDLTKVPADDRGVVVRLEHESQPSRSITLHRRHGPRGVFEAEVNDLPVGEVTLHIVSPTSSERTGFIVQPPPGEMAKLQVDSNAMRQASQRSGGNYYTVDRMRALIGDLPQGERTVVISRPGIPLWNHWLLVVWVIGLVLTEWIVRKRMGMF